MLAPSTLLQNRYLVVRQLGQGGMGAVYEAVDQKFGSSVALKQLTVEGDLLLKAFEREARLLNTLKHAALPKVMDYFTDVGGQFLVMEFIAGEDLAQSLRRNGGAFVPETVLRWADHLLSALEYLHSRRPPIIHRDIKPQNLKLTPEGDIILLDFGLAKGTPGHMTQTAASVVGYTRFYASLEQIRGLGTDARSDLYSLAATLYHLMTGRLAVDSLSRADVVLQGHEDPLVPAHAHNPRVPVAISELLRRAMALKRDERPATAAEMRAALKRAVPTSASTIMMAAPLAPGAPPSMPPPPSRSAAGAAPVDPTAWLPDSAPGASSGAPPRAPQSWPPAHPPPGAPPQETDELSSLPSGARSHPSPAPAPAVWPDPAPPAPTVWPDPAPPQYAAATSSAAAPPTTAEPASRSRAIWPAAAGGLLVVVVLGILAFALAWPFAPARPEAAPTAGEPAPGRAAPGRPAPAPEFRAAAALEVPFKFYDVALSPEGGLMAVAGDSKQVLLRRGADAGRVADLQGPAEACGSVAFSPDGRTVVAGSDDGRIYLWTSAAEGAAQPVGSLPGHADGTFMVRVSGDGRTLASAGNDRTVRIWNMAERALVSRLQIPDGALVITVEPTHQLAALYDRPGASAAVWSVAEGRQLARRGTGAAKVTSGAFSPDGARLMLGQADGSVRVVDARSGELVATLEGPGGEVGAVAYSRDGAWVAAGGARGAVRVWEAGELREVTTLAAHTAYVLGIAFSADGRSMATADEKRSVRVWRL